MAILLAVVLLLPLGAVGDSAAATVDNTPSILGLWDTEDHDGVVELYACVDKICGRFYWLKDDAPNKVARDENNPDPAKKQRPLCHMDFMGDFAAAERGGKKWSGGWIYSPLHGQNFQAELTLMDANTLDLHGYILLPVFGQSQTWTRAKNPKPCVTSAL